MLSGISHSICVSFSEDGFSLAPAPPRTFAFITALYQELLGIRSSTDEILSWTGLRKLQLQCEWAAELGMIFLLSAHAEALSGSSGAVPLDQLVLWRSLMLCALQ